MNTKLKLMLPAIILAIIGFTGVNIIDAQKFWELNSFNWFDFFTGLLLTSLGIMLGIQNAFGKKKEGE